MSDFGSLPDREGRVTTYTYSAEDRLVSISEPSAPAYSFEHDEKKRVFRVTGPVGQTTEFHDRPVRFLIVEQDHETGELQPVITRRGPKVIYLCREAGL